MNQILITGEEIVGKTKRKKEKKLVSVNKIIIFFYICIIIIGGCMIFSSVYSKTKINQIVAQNTKPTVQIERNDNDNTIEIKINHIKGIKSITYKWNDEDETTINGNNQKEILEKIDLIGGKNTLTVTVTDEDEQFVTYQKEYTVGNLPEIQLEAVSNGVKVIANCEDGIDIIRYSWDENDEETINVEGTNYEGIINAPKGQHTLKIIVVSSDGIETEKTQLVVGDTEPTLNIKAEIINDKLYFIVDAEDDEQITKVEIISNEGETQTVEVKDKTYHTEIEIGEGQNKLKVTVYNKNGLSKKLGVIYNN